MPDTESTDQRPKCVYPLGYGQCGSEDGLHTVKGKDNGVVCDKHRIDVVKTWDWDEIDRIRSKL